MTICMNNPNRWIGSTGRDSLTWAKTELYVWMMNDEGVAEQLDYEIQDVYFTDKDKIAPNYERKPKEGDEVVVDNDQVRITYIGSYIIDELDKNAFSNDPYFYVENKTDHDLKIEVEGTATLDGKTAKIFLFSAIDVMLHLAIQEARYPKPQQTERDRMILKPVFASDNRLFSCIKISNNASGKRRVIVSVDKKSKYAVIFPTSRKNSPDTSCFF